MSEKIMERIAKLLAQADHPNTSDTERDAYLAKADEMMLRHAIDEATIRANQSPEERRKPVRVDVELYDQHTVYGQKMRLLFHEVCRTVSVKAATRSRGNVVTLVGYADDVKWAQLLFTNIHITFLRKLQPKWDPSLDRNANIAALRECGLKWADIGRQMVRAGFPSMVDTGMADAYYAHCKTQGTEPIKQMNRHEAYRHTYAESFTNRICSRLEDMREARHRGSTGSELVLASSWEDVQEAFYDEFPNMRPEDPEVSRRRWEQEWEQEREQHAAWLLSMTPRERLAHEREFTKEQEKNARASNKFWAQRAKRDEALYDWQGSKAGRNAANSVNLSTREDVDQSHRKPLA